MPTRSPKSLASDSRLVASRDSRFLKDPALPNDASDVVDAHQVRAPAVQVNANRHHVLGPPFPGFCFCRKCPFLNGGGGRPPSSWHHPTWLPIGPRSEASRLTGHDAVRAGLRWEVGFARAGRPGLRSPPRLARDRDGSEVPGRYPKLIHCPPSYWPALVPRSPSSAGRSAEGWRGG